MHSGAKVDFTIFVLFFNNLALCILNVLTSSSQRVGVIGLSISRVGVIGIIDINISL